MNTKSLVDCVRAFPTTAAVYVSLQQQINRAVYCCRTSCLRMHSTRVNTVTSRQHASGQLHDSRAVGAWERECAAIGCSDHRELVRPACYAVVWTHGAHQKLHCGRDSHAQHTICSRNNNNNNLQLQLRILRKPADNNSVTTCQRRNCNTSSPVSPRAPEAAFPMASGAVAGGDALNSSGGDANVSLACVAACRGDTNVGSEATGPRNGVDAPDLPVPTSAAAVRGGYVDARGFVSWTAAGDAIGKSVSASAATCVQGNI